MPLAVRTILTLFIGALGGVAGELVGVPAGFLMGAALATTLATIAGFKASMPAPLRDTTFIFVGLSMGATVAPDSLAMIAQWPLTMAGLALEMVVITLLSGFLLMKLFRFDVGTAYLSSFPGHLAMVMGIASAGVGEARQIVVIQVMRVMMLTMCVPIGALFLPISEVASEPAQEVMSLWTLALMVAGCVGTGMVFTRLKLPAGYILGSMIFAMGMKFSGMFTGAMHPWLLGATFIAMGALTGARFAGISRAELVASAKYGTFTTALTVAVVTGFALGLTLLVDMPFGQIWLGLSPGGIESMGALGVALGYDTAFIAAHHAVRLILLGLAIPIVAVLLRRLEQRLGG